MNDQEPPVRMPIAVKHDGAQVMGETTQLIVPSTNGANISGGTTVSSHHHMNKASRKGVVGVDEQNVEPSDHVHDSHIVDGPEAVPGSDWVTRILRALHDGLSRYTTFSVAHHGNTNADQQTAIHDEGNESRQMQVVHLDPSGPVQHEICAGETRLIINRDGALLLALPTETIDLRARAERVAALEQQVDRLAKELERNTANRLTLVHLRDVVERFERRITMLEQPDRDARPAPAPETGPSPAIAELKRAVATMLGMIERLEARSS